MIDLVLDSDRHNIEAVCHKCKGADILMAHLLGGSITSQVGSSVKLGEPIISRRGYCSWR